MTEQELPVTLTLTVKDWQEIIAGLSWRSINGSFASEKLNQRITAIVSAQVQSFRSKNEL